MEKDDVIMAVNLLEMRRVLINSCWPYSGRKYSVWQGDKCLIHTDCEEEANAKASET